MKATLYVPGQPAQELSQEQVNSLVVGVVRGMLTCWEHVAESTLQVPDTEVLHVDESVAVWGRFNAWDYGMEENEAASEAAARIGIHPALDELYGPILLVQA